MITEKQKQIYNLYIRALRTNNNKPFKYKKNWDKFEETANFLYTQKIEKTFERFPHFFCIDFFDAPYKIYDKSDQFFTLKFYASQAAISAYISYTKLRKEQSPDEQHDYIKESFVFIANFCKDKNIKFKDYIKFKSVAQNDCLIHLKEHKISWYTVFDIPGFYELLYNLPEDEFQLYFGKVSLHDINIKLKSSNSTKELIKNCTDRVNDFLRKKA